MAKNDEITTRFKADIKDFKKNIQEAGKQMTLINSKFTKASDGTKKWENSVDGLGSKVNQLKGRLEQHNKKLEDYKNILKSAQKYEEESKQKVEELEKALEKAKQEYGEDSKEVKKLERQLLAAEKEESKFAGIIRDTTVSINKEEGAIKRTTAELNEYDNKLQETKKAQTLSGKASNIFNKGLSAMGEKLKGFAGNVVQYATDKLKELGEETIENGKKFTSAMSKVKAISSSNSGEFKKLSNKALEMGKNTKFSATESAEAFTYMSMAGWKTKDMLDGIEGIMNLAAASGEDLAKTSDIVTDSLTAFGLKAKDTNRFVDVLAQASRNSNTNVSLMGESFKYVAPIAGQFRYRVEDVALGLGIMANSGIKATSAGTSLRAIFTRLATNAGATKNSIGALDVVTQKLGVRFYDEQGKIRPFGDFLTDLRKKWKGLSDSEKINFAKKIAGMNALSGFNTLVEASDEDFKKLKKSIDGSSGAAKEMADVMEDNLEGDFHKLNSSIESVEQKIYKKLEPALRKGVQNLKEFIDEYNNGINETESPKDFLKARGKGIYDFLFDDTTINDLKRFGSDVKKGFSDINTVIDNGIGKVREEFSKPTFFDDTTINDLKRFGSNVKKGFSDINTVIDNGIGKVREEFSKPTFFDDTTINDLKRFG
ncbi:MAG: phage tail tape measure protein, partial [Lachnobacterium sp.]|nr:phage tail tape measure protein [Lachnobacterium sp.]